MMVSMYEIPQETIETALTLAAEGLPVEQIAFMARVSLATAQAIIEHSTNEIADQSKEHE